MFGIKKRPTDADDAYDLVEIVGEDRERGVVRVRDQDGYERNANPSSVVARIPEHTITPRGRG